MDNVAWNVLVALGSGIVSSVGTTMTMRRAKHEDLDKRIDERACVLIGEHKDGCPSGDRIESSMRMVKIDLGNQIAREKHERESDRSEDRDRIVVLGDRLSAGQEELQGGQKEIVKQLATVVVAVTEIRGHLETMDSERKTLAGEVERIRDQQNGRAVRKVARAR